MPVGTDKEIEKNYNNKKADDRQLVIFKIAGEEFGVDINEVKEIIRWTDVTRIPNTEIFIKGVINLRGSIVVVNDLAMKMGLPSKEIDDDTRILVVEVGANTVGMIVDSATEVLRLDGDRVKDAPSMITTSIDNNFIDGVGVLGEDRLLTLLDLSKVMGSDFDHVVAVQQSIDSSTVKDVADVDDTSELTNSENVIKEKNENKKENMENKKIKDNNKSEKKVEEGM